VVCAILIVRSRQTSPADVSAARPVMRPEFVPQDKAAS
jgi:hypothetical protein